MKIKVTIQGTVPILFNRFAEENEVKVASGINPVQGGQRGTPREQAEKKLYQDVDGNLFLPSPMLFSCLVDAGKFHKVGRNKVTTQKTSLVPAGISVEELIIPFNTKDWEIDSRSVVIPSTGGRIMCHRPRLDEWQLTFTLDVDTTMFDPKFVRTLMDDAGKKCGLGDYRPNRKGPFGKFVVINWEEEK
jgi:hypothetical protein